VSVRHEESATGTVTNPKEEGQKGDKEVVEKLVARMLPKCSNKKEYSVKFST
jgi:ribosomal protein L13